MEELSLLERAIIFATKAHHGILRKGKQYAYIVHPLEAVSIVATMSEDEELLSAAALHDVIEDTEYTAEDLEREFGKKVCSLVLAETQEEPVGVSGVEKWRLKRSMAIEKLRKATMEEKIVAIGDKLSNMRGIAIDYSRIGDKVWDKFSVKNKLDVGWYYNSLVEAFFDLKDTEAYQEFEFLVNIVFNRDILHKKS